MNLILPDYYRLRQNTLTCTTPAPVLLELDSGYHWTTVTPFMPLIRNSYYLS